MKTPELKTKQKTQWELEFNEKILINGLYIIRVPGGWIYQDIRQGAMCASFVPYSDEFAPAFNWDKLPV